MIETNTQSGSPAASPASSEQSTLVVRARNAAAWAARNKLYVLLAVSVLAVGFFGVFTEDVNPGTDDAQVDGHSIVIAPRVPGYVQKMLIDDNTRVKQGDLMIQLDPADYQAKVDEARAALQVAEARATALKIMVPFTIGTTSSATVAASAHVERWLGGKLEWMKA